MVVASSLGQLPVGKIIGGQKCQHAGHAVGQRGGHLFALTCATPSHQSGQNPHGGVRTGDQVGDGGRGPHGRAIGKAVHAHEAAHGLGNEVKGGALRIRPI